MPYKHKNGCTCMTMPEFLEAEGAREGKTGADVWADICDEMETDARNQENFWRENPDEVLKLLKEQAQMERECIEEQVPEPVEVVEVVEVKCGYSLRSSSSSMRVKARCEDGVVRLFKVSESHWPGTFYDPPEDDFSFEWEEINA